MTENATKSSIKQQFKGEKYMKAIVLRHKENFDHANLEEVKTPEPKSNEVIIKLKAAALNRRDLLIISGRYPGVKLPVILGSDGAGIITEVGNQVNTTLLNKDVIINPGLNWGLDPKRKSSNFTILGMPSDGTYAQYIRVPATNVYPKPPHLSWEEAASLPLAALTAYRALVTKGNVKKGETVLIPGAGGGVATYLIQFASKLGAKVYITSSSNEKIEKAKSFGAIDGVNYTSEDWVESLMKLTGGIDLSIDSIGGDVFNNLLSLGKIGSRVVSFGATRGSVPNLVLPNMSVKEMTVIGSTMGSAVDFEEMLKFVEDFKIHPIVDDVFPFEDYKKALNKMEEGGNLGKIVLTITHD